MAVCVSDRGRVAAVRLDRGLAVAIAVVAVVPAAAQSPATPVTPLRVVSRPASPPPASNPPDTLDPDAPLADLPDLGVAWPDLATAPADPVQSTATMLASDALRYGYRIDGIDTVATPLLRQRFAALSVLRANEGKPANAAQLDRRAREDAELLTTLLKAEGYYDTQVTSAVAADADRGAGRVVVTLTAEPGVLYTFDRVTLTGIERAGDKSADLTATFGVGTAAPVNADTVQAAEDRLRGEVGRQGFAFGTVGEPAIVVDRAAKTATLDLNVAPGTSRRLGQVVLAPASVARAPFDARHIQNIARFSPGEPYDTAALDDLRRALVQTGLVSTATVRPVPAADPALVDVQVAIDPAPPRTVAGELGYGTGEGARAALSWTHRNLFPPEGALTLRGVLGTQEQLAAIAFRRNNVRARDRVLNLQLAASNLQRDAYRAKTIGLSGSLERQSNIFFQKTWTWSVGGELLASDERDVIRATGQPRRRTYFIGALPGTLAYDGSDDLLNPTRGFRLAGRLSPELSFVGRAFGYARTQFDASAYQPVGDRVVLAERVRLGTIVGAPRDAIAPSRRFYAGGGGSVRGYGYQAIGPRDINNDPVGGRSLAEFSLEARVRAFGNFGIVPFIDGGNISTGTLPALSSFRFGTGIGVRYYSSFGPIRIDVGTPINPRMGDTRIAVYVSLGQAF